MKNRFRLYRRPSAPSISVGTPRVLVGVSSSIAAQIPSGVSGKTIDVTTGPAERHSSCVCGTGVNLMADSGLDVAACLARVRRRDEAAARELVAHLHPLVMKIVRSHLPRRMDEEDLAQEVFLKIFANLSQYRGAVPLEHWVSRVAVTTCLDKLRAQKRRPEWRWADLSETEAEVLDAVLSDEKAPHAAQALAAREVIEKLLDSLNAEDRMVVTLLDLEDRSVAEIQQLTGWSATLVKVRAFRARLKMRKQLARLENEKNL